jgi:tRNA threonylcarbamoyladenosine biosynthesis protein TsaB
MLLLAIDTSTQQATVALARDEEMIWRSEQVTTHSERLVLIIDALFAELGVAPRELGAVVCASGPGSFTGLRIGLATAKGLCFGTGAPLVLVPSLPVRAAIAPAHARVLAAVDAFRGEVYAGFYALDDARQPRAIDEALAAFTAAPDALRARIAPLSPTHAVGDGFVRHPSALPDGAVLLSTEEGGALAAALVRLGRVRLDAGEHDDPRTAVPFYVRASAPEEAQRQP